MIGHVLDWVQKVDAGFLGQCSCGKRLEHTARASVDVMHEQHVHLEELRATLKESSAQDS